MSNVTLTGSFVEANVFVTAAVAAVIADAGEHIRQGAADRSRVASGEMRDGWSFQMTGPTSGEVYNDVPHALWNEVGTSRMTAQPMLYPAVDAERQPFLDALAHVVGRP